MPRVNITQEEIDSLRLNIIESAETYTLSERFTVLSTQMASEVVILDEVTERSTVVCLTDYAGVRKALNELFGHNE